MSRRTILGLLSGTILLATTGVAAAAPVRAADGVVVTAWHGEREVPSFVWAAGAAAPAGATAEQAARYHLERLAGLYGAGRAAVRGARLVHVHDTGRGGIVVVLRPTVAGVDVMGGDVKVLLDRRLGLRALSGSLHPAARPDSARPFTLPAPAAIAAALRDLYGLDVPADRWKPAREFERAGSRYYELAEAVPELRLDRPARVRPVYYPVGGKLVPAHRIELQTTYGERRQGDAWLYVIAADDGRVLVRRDNVQRDAFTYRVWADADGDRRPLDGPLADYTPHPLGEPMGTPGPGAAPVLVTMEGFNTNPDGLADPWLPPGATETIGNNVDAYCNPTSAPSYGGADFRATVTAPGVFDRVYDLGKEPFASPEQGMASATQLFYTTNWLHDWWYDSGFNESAGNAQMDNFGRGGVGGDPLLALAQDNLYNGLYDNAYMVTPEDGESPEMHMLLWSVEAVDVKLTVGPMNQALMAGQAKFGPKTYDVTAEVVLVDDGAGKSPSDGCEPPANDLTGKIALIDSGTCAHEIKTTRAEEAGALAVIIANSVPNQAPPSPGQDWDIVDPTIPTVGVTKEDGDALKALLENATVTAHMVGNTPPMRDGTLDNLVVAHEWGHYLHLRLVECLNLQCYAQSEGWGDFLALHLALREGDDLHGTYSEANYGGFDPTYYFGGRRQPYSVDFDRNALTFRHISDGEKLPDHYPTNDWGFPNSEPHNAGEVWATMLWEVYVAMHEAGAGRKSFAEIRRAMSDYVVGGMLLAPPAPTYVEQRDAILAVMAEQDPVDFAAAAAAFARRGAGTCAIAPPRHSVTLEGVVEDFEVRPVGLVAAAKADDSPLSCDGDGAVDVGEEGQLTVEIMNRGGADLAGAKLTVVADSPSITFTQPTSVELDALAPLEKQTLVFPFTLPDTLPGVELASIRVTLTTPGGCANETSRDVPVVLHGDAADAASPVDDVEAEATLWTAGGSQAAKVWAREPNVSSGMGWHARDLDELSDAWLMSPVFTVAQDQPLKITFDHAYYFDGGAVDDTTYAWDGGVIEISLDGGKTWADVGAYTDPGYSGMLSGSNNPLALRPAFVLFNEKYPYLEPVTLDFGTQFAGQQIRIRFRMGSDEAIGAPGWYIDNIGFFGVTTTPFPGWTTEPGGDCPVGPEPTTGADESETAGMEPTTGEGGTAGTGTSDGATTGSQTGSDGCGCRAEGPAGALSLLALAGLRRRRRRP